MTSIPSPIRVAIVQIDLVSNDVQTNLDRLSIRLEEAAPHADLIVLPEVFSTGFSIEAAQYADTWGQDGAIYHWLISHSQQYGVGIIGSYLTKDEAGKVYNRFVIVDGSDIEYQDKRHLFALGGEPDMVCPAKVRKILNFRGWRIMPLVCYDLRFPVWARCVHNDYDLLITVASWPRGRRTVWQTLLVARAMENLAYSIGVNRVGTDAVGLGYTGDSAVIDPRGKVLASVAESTEGIAYSTLDYEPLADLRQKFPVWQDADSFTIHKLHSYLTPQS